MKKRSIVLFVMFLFLAWLSGISTAQETALEGDYLIFFGNQLAGVSHYQVMRVDSGENLRLSISTETIIYAKIRNRGNIEFSQKLDAIIDTTTNKPISYVIQNKSPFKTEETSIEFGPNRAKVIRKTGISLIEKSFFYSEIPYIIDIRNPGGGNWNIPLLQYFLKAEELYKKDTLRINGLYTGTFENLTVTLNKERLSGDCPYIVYNMSEGTGGTTLNQRVFLSPENGKIIKMESPSENFTYKLEGKRKVHNPPEIFNASVIPLAGDLKNCGYIKTQVKIRVLNEVLSPENLKIGGQKFEGSFHDGTLEGVVNVRSLSFKTLTSPEYPCYFKEEWLKKYLEPEFLVESEDEAVRNQAMRITKGIKTLKDAVVRLGTWIYDNVDFEFTDGSAKATLLSKKGDWLPMIRLFIAMCRSVGIPARYAGGFLVNENIAGRYIWAEAYFGSDSGWIPVDTAMGQIEYFSANHLTLWHGGFFDPFTIKPELKILEYEEEARPKGSKFVVP